MANTARESLEVSQLRMHVVAGRVCEVVPLGPATGQPAATLEGHQDQKRHFSSARHACGAVGRVQECHAAAYHNNSLLLHAS